MQKDIIFFINRIITINYCFITGIGINKCFFFIYVIIFLYLFRIKQINP